MDALRVQLEGDRYIDEVLDPSEIMSQPITLAREQCVEVTYEHQLTQNDYIADFVDNTPRVTSDNHPTIAISGRLTRSGIFTSFRP